MSKIQTWPWPFPPRSVDPDSRPARGCGQVCWGGGEGPRHRCFVRLPEQGGGAGHRTLGHGAQPAAAGQPWGSEGTRALFCTGTKYVSYSVWAISYQLATLYVFLMFLAWVCGFVFSIAGCNVGQLSCKVLCPEHVAGLVLLGQQLPGLPAGGRWQCWTQRRRDGLPGQTGGLHLPPAHRHLG